MADNNREALLTAIRSRGAPTRRELGAALGISQATFSRLIKSASPQVFRLGRGPATRYAVSRAITGVLARIPVFQVDEEGVARASGALVPLHGGGLWLELDGAGILYEGLPPFVQDMRPQGFMGRAFASCHRDLGLPERVIDWNDDHVLRALTARGEDTVGNIIIGDAALQRFVHGSAGPRRAISLAGHPEAIDELAMLANEGQPAGSSAGGERPKFAAWVELPGRGNMHAFIKYSPPRDGDAGRRWSDLLVCEALAADVLNANGIAAAASSVIATAQRTHLVVQRFDRVGERGRRGVVSLGALDDFYFGMRDDFSQAAVRLERAGRIAGRDARTLQGVHCFGLLIANSDMHFGNISFFPGARERFALAPVYDMLPMLYSPINDQLVERRFEPPALPVSALASWSAAFSMAIDFWRSVSRHADISEAFRRIAAENAAMVERQRVMTLRSVA